MFTGIIKAVGTVDRLRRQGSDMRLSIRCTDLPWRDYEIGDSISVNGTCLTAVELRDAGFDAEVSSETMAVTAMRELQAGSRVNIEPSLTLADRLGGHLVSGHVDCVGRVVERRDEAGSLVLRIVIPPQYRRYIVRKGSICIDGVSLTINEVLADSFTVNIIPHTAKATIASGYASGCRVNIEVDLIARYLERLLQRDAGDAAAADTNNNTCETISRDFLRAYGYA
ncbi:MAG: riboflavin synthase [Woeseia sp.]